MLAGVAGEQGRWLEAEADYREVLQARRRVLNDDHPDTLATGRRVEVPAGRRRRS